MSLINYFKTNSLVTEIGELSYDGDIGEGGNAKVLAFKKGDFPYAVKFLPHDRKNSLARFRDEFFCAAQIPSHPNITRAFHLDRTQIEEKIYSLIIMKRYQYSLHKFGNIADKDDAIKAKLGWNLLNALCNGIGHLHKHSIVHRDIKPQNIFVDQQEEVYVIGDLGIAHFSDDLYAREANTGKAERLANFACCAPEQVDPGISAAATMDIFALGQVLNWFIRGAFVRGGGRPLYSGPEKNLELLDRIIDRCIRDDPKHRFQNIGDIEAFIANSRKPPRDVWKPIRDLDTAFRASIPRIPEVFETNDQVTIDRFLTNFSSQCNVENFWYVLSDGGDNEVRAFSKLESGRWLVSNFECRIEKLICYRYTGEWQSFFALLLAADDPFDVTDPNGQLMARPNMTSWEHDEATFYDGRYLETEDSENGYFLHGDEMIRIDQKKAEWRQRFLRRDAILIVPEGAGIVRSSDRRSNTSFLKNLIATGTTDKAKIRALIDSNIRFTNPEITNRL